jgi:hypothetical protein
MRRGSAKVAWRYSMAHFATVIVLDLEISLANRPNVAAVRFRKAQAGSVPIPVQQVVAYAAHRARNCEFHRPWVDENGDAVALVRLPVNEKLIDQGLRIETLELRDGEMRLTGRFSDPAPPAQITAPRTHDQVCEAATLQNRTRRWQ